MSTESDAGLEVVRSVSVPLSQVHTFELFTTRMTDFWPKQYSIGNSEIAEVVVEPCSGGRWFERGVDGSECLWGRVASWDPPREVVLLWQIGADWRFDPAFRTEVEVSFTPEESGRTRLDLRHRNLQRYGDNAEQMRAIFDNPSGWTGVLARFVDLCAFNSSTGPAERETNP
ncbi:MAG: SRPBCC family protein [Mycobacterium sp.]|nr:SRPBCC family protein [Mycobacterium sp.]